MTTSFDPNQFLDMQITDSNDTVLRPVPAGEYVAIATSVECRPWQGKNDPTQAGIALDIKWEIDDQDLTAELGRKPTVKQGIMLDTTESGGLDMGKGRNVGLGRLRAAVDLNKPGQPFSFSMVTGRAAKVLVSHRPDKSNPEIVYAEVKGVTAL